MLSTGSPHLIAWLITTLGGFFFSGDPTAVCSMTNAFWSPEKFVAFIPLPFSLRQRPENLQPQTVQL